LNIETERLEDHQIKVTVEVEQDNFEAAKRRAARKLAKKTRIPGFRPGKAPYTLIVRHLGEPAVIDEAVELLINDIYPSIIEQTEIDPYGPGKLEDIASLDPLTLEFLIPLRAETELGDYGSIRVPYELPPVAEDVVERVIKDLLERQAIVEPVERPAQETDMVYVRLTAKKKNAEAEEQADIIKDRSLPVIIETGDDETDEWPFPGFSRNLIGLSAGDEKVIEYRFPEDSDYESLRGVLAEFHVVVEEVKSRTLPELDDEFAQSLGEYETVADLRQAIRADLEAQARERYHKEYDEQALDKLVEISTVKYPPQMLENEIDNVIHRLNDDLAQQNLDLDLYLKSREMSMDELREEVKPVAETRIKKSLTLLALSEKENITVSPDELQTETTKAFNELSYVMPEKDLKKLLNQDEARTEIVSKIMMDMLIARCQDRLREIARGLAVEAETEPEETTAEAEEAPTLESEAASEAPSAEEAEPAEEAEGQGDPQAEPPVSELATGDDSE